MLHDVITQRVYLVSFLLTRRAMSSIAVAAWSDEWMEGSSLSFPQTLPRSFTLRREQNENLLTFRKDLKIGSCHADVTGKYVVHNVKRGLWVSIRDRLLGGLLQQQGYQRTEMPHQHVQGFCRHAQFFSEQEFGKVKWRDRARRFYAQKQGRLFHQ